jgi:glycosyltransferase involved in cell wall biosynthesis
MDASLPLRLLGQQLVLPRAFTRAGCDVLLSPGGTLPTRCPLPTVVICQNMLPFEPKEAARFGRFSLMRLKMWLLRHSQGRSFLLANGIIFLSRYAQSAVCQALGLAATTTALIPHGIESRFSIPPRQARALASCTEAEPFRVLYVSILMPYKHQLAVARAASQLRSEGIPIEIRFVGAPWGQYGEDFEALLKRLDPSRRYLLWAGQEPFDSLHHHYRSADAFVFASSCENLPNILIEAMAAGLPIACSNRGPMPEILGSAGVYFDPEDLITIVSALRQLANDVALRAQLAEQAWKAAQVFSWERCARETFEYVADVAMKRKESIHV